MNKVLIKKQQLLLIVLSRNLDIWILLCIKWNSMNRKVKPRMFRGVLNIWKKSFKEWCYRLRICSWLLLMLIVGHLMSILIKLKIISDKIGKIDISSFINLLKYSPEIISKFQSYQESTIICIVQCMLLTYSHSLALPSHFLTTH